MKILSAIIITLLFVVEGSSQPTNTFSFASDALFIPAEKKIFFTVGDKQVPVRILQYGEPKNIVCINLHDNEGTSVDAARTVLEQKGGTLIKIENNKQRLIRFRLKGIFYSFDPNRMFSRTGIEQTLRDNRRFSIAAMDEIEKFAQQLLSLIPDSASCVIALHNNTEEAYSVKSYLPGSDRQWDAKAVYADSLQDIDDIALTTDSLLYQQMADSGYNSIWQDNENAKKDGSLSIYYGERNKRYINIETQHGRVMQYVEMLEKLFAILSGENKKVQDELGASQ